MTLDASKLHEFEERLAWSQQASHEAFWETVYHKAFPNMIGHQLCLGNNWAQHMGVDRFIMLDNSTVLKVDEKKRESVYPDILLEFLSNDKTGAKGWMDKPLTIDYLSYAFMPTRKVYLFPWLLLRRAWADNRDAWLRQYRIVKAKNRGYLTHSVAVPILTLQVAIKEASIVEVTAEEVAQTSNQIKARRQVA